MHLIREMVIREQSLDRSSYAFSNTFVPFLQGLDLSSMFEPIEELDILRRTSATLLMTLNTYLVVALG